VVPVVPQVVLAVARVVPAVAQVNGGVKAFVRPYGGAGLDGAAHGRHAGGRPNDDNGARDRVVKAYLKDADSIWIVSNIKRAVNDRTAKVGGAAV